MHQELNLNGIWQCLPDADNTREGVIENKIVYASNNIAWHDITVPSHWQKAGFEGHQGVMWYRKKFNAPEKQAGTCFYLHFGAVDYFSEVWLNGVYLGAHEGDFDSFRFNVTDILHEKQDNELIVKVISTIDNNPERKAIAKGGLYHWDCLPVRQEGLKDCPEVPSAANAQYPNPLINPGGIWQGVRLLQKSAANIHNVRVTSLLQDDYEKANVYVDISIENEAWFEQELEIRTRVIPHNFVGDEIISLTETVMHRPGTLQHTTRVTVDQPRLWWSRELGTPHLYQAVTELWQNEKLLDSRTHTFGIREIKLDESWGFYLNGKRLFIKGNNYVSDQFLSIMNEEGYKTDLDLMAQANMNMTRLFAHAEREEFYRLCDEQGMLVFQDLPFQWGYRSDGEFISRAADVSARFVRMLYNHPSVVLWCCHSESRYHDYNKLDSVLLRTVQQNDRTRPVHKNSVLVAEGKLPDFFATWDDFAEYIPNHLSVNWVGWYWGEIDDAEHYNPLFITEYGTQSLPDEESLRKFISEDELWPADLDAWRMRGFQNNIYTKMMGDYPATLTEMIERTQAYQVRFYKEHTEALRRKKYKNVSGILQFHFVNTWPAIDWSIIDYYRKPKRAFYAVAKAFEPLQLSFAGEMEAGEQSTRLTMEAWIVNDFRTELEGHEVSYRLLDENGTVVEERIVLAPVIEEDSSRCFDRASIEVPAHHRILKIEGELRDQNGSIVAHNDKVIFPKRSENEIETAARAKVGL
jgi:beta-mannosidase